MTIYYECTECQSLHWAGSGTFDLHIRNQSKRSLLQGESPSEQFSKMLDGANNIDTSRPHCIKYTIGSTEYFAKRYALTSDPNGPYWLIDNGKTKTRLYDAELRS